MRKSPAKASCLPGTLGCLGLPPMPRSRCRLRRPLALGAALAALLQLPPVVAEALQRAQALTPDQSDAVQSRD